MSDGTRKLLIVGGGFAGIQLARALGDGAGAQVTLVDRRNHHLFQPLLYQVATGGLSPTEISSPIRSLVAGCRNVTVLREEVTSVDLEGRAVLTSSGAHPYDLLVLACGARHSYFGHEEWEPHAPGLKTLEQAVEIRRRVLSAFEEAESESDPARRRALLTFVVVGGGPTGVELAGAIGEMSRTTLARDFRNIDPTHTRVILLEAGPRILAAFAPKSSARAMRDLESLGVQVWTHSPVSAIDESGVCVGEERIEAATVLWGAGVQAAPLARTLGVELDRQGRVKVNPDLSLPGHPEVFVAGDMAHCPVAPEGPPLPGVASVAIQQGRFLAENLRRELRGEPRQDFRYRDKGRMATIGRSRAVVEMGRLRLGGLGAWLMWLVVHIGYLTGLKNRLFVALDSIRCWLTKKRGSRLIIEGPWRFYEDREGAPAAKRREVERV